MVQDVLAATAFWGPFFEVLFFVIWIGTIIVVITENRNALKTLAWVTVLIFLPILGLVLYFFFGMDVHKSKIITRRSLSLLLKKPLLNYEDHSVNEPPAKYDKLVNMMKKANQSYLLGGNDVKVYTEFWEMFQDTLRAIAKAKHHIHVQFYILSNDPVGRLLRDALADKVREGVKVRVLYDDVGSWSWKLDKSYFYEMEKMGIEVYPFGEVRFALFTHRVNYRNHRKVVIVDGEVGFMGGMNISERYYRGISWGHWRDTHLRIKGTAVNALQTSFLADWYYATQKLISNPVYFPKVEPQGNTMMQIVTSYPMGDFKVIMQGMLQAISQSREYVYIQTPYFLPTEPIMMALRNAALAGVDVRIMVPERSDSPLTHLASHSYFKEAMKAGIKIYHYQGGFLHAKTMVSDDSFVSIGSTNIDFRSFELNFEISSFMYDSNVAKESKQIFLKDQETSVLLTYSSWAKRPRWIRFWESLARLFSPLL